MNPRPVYLDNNATTALLPEARAAMEPFLSDCYSNPSSPYAFARPASRALALAREQVAALAGVDPALVVFTSGGTESNNLALHAALSARPERRHIILTAVEHKSLLAPARAWEQQGWRVTRIPVTIEGELDSEALERALDEDTALVSMMGANNETGVCYPVTAWRERVHAVGAWLHTDAVQVAGKLDLPEADFLSLCAHKMHGPKGAGALVVPTGLRAQPLLAGGEQEAGWRGGTENVAAVAGFGAAAERVLSDRSSFAATSQRIRDELERVILQTIPDSYVVGRQQPRLPNTTLFQFAGVSTEALLARLDLAGFCCSSGSACAAGAHEPSHVLQAHGVQQRGAALRVSTSRFTDPRHTVSLVSALVDSIHQLRSTTRDSSRRP